MKYYKIIINEIIKAVASSKDFKVYFPKHNFLLEATERNVQYIFKNGYLYHAEWMIEPAENLKYEQAIILEIDEQEYNDLNNLFIAAAEREEEIELFEEPKQREIIQPVIIDPYENYTLDYVIAAKLKQLSNQCNKTIESGFDIELSDNEIHHFSLTTQDQLNLINLQSMIDQGMEEIPYHADNELCEFYSLEDMNDIITRALWFKTYHTTYYNALKNYIKSLNDVHTIANIEYGIEIPEEYKSEVLKTLE